MAARASSAPDERGFLAALIQLVLLALWLGAAAFFAAVVAPAAFDVLPSRELAGALVGRALPGLFVAGVVTGLAALVLEWRGPARRSATGRRIAASAMILACAVAQFAVSPRIASIRGELTAPLASLAIDDPRRVAFGRLHMLSVGWLGIAMAAGGVTIVLAARTLRPRGSP